METNEIACQTEAEEAALQSALSTKEGERRRAERGSRGPCSTRSEMPAASRRAIASAGQLGLRLVLASRRARRRLLHLHCLVELLLDPAAAP